MLKRQLNQPFSISIYSETEESAWESPAKVAKTAETLAKLAEDLVKTAAKGLKTAEVGDLAETAKVLAKKAKVLAKTTLVKTAEHLAQEAEFRAETARVLAEEEKDPVRVAEFRARAVWCHAEADRMHGRRTILILQEERRRVTVWDQIQEKKKEGKYPTFCSDSICSDGSFAVLRLVLSFLEAEVKAADDRQAVAYVANVDSATVSVIDVVSHAVIETIPVVRGPSAVAITPNGTEAYVINGGGTISIINTASHTVTGTIKVGGGHPYKFTISPDGTRAYMINYNENGSFSSETISVIDMVRHVVITTIGEEENFTKEGKEDFMEVAITPDGTRAYVICDVTIIIIDTDSNQVIHAMDVGEEQLRGVAISPDGTQVYVISQFAVVVIDTASHQVIDKMEVGGYLYAVVITPDGKELYVANSDKGTVIVIDTASYKVIATIPVGEEVEPQHIAITPDGTKVYVTNRGSGTVSVIDTASHVVSATISVGEGPAGIAISRRLTWQ
jgi:YVTN family beta-propeller protein